MKILLIRANPRTTGFTETLTDLFLQGMRDEGAEIIEARLHDMDIRPCSGCYQCWLATPGVCYQKDDMAVLLEQIMDTDVLVCATPIYYYSISSRLQRFLERTFPLTMEGLDRTPEGLFRNRTRFPDRWHDKRIVFLAVGALRSPRNFKPLKETCKLIAHGLNMELAGLLVRAESHLSPFPLMAPKTFKRMNAAFISAGRAVARTGHIPKSIQHDAGIPLSPDEEDFEEHCNIFYDKAKTLGRQALLVDNTVEQVGLDPQVIFLRMISAVDPRATASVHAVIQFEFPDIDAHFCITIDDGKAEMERCTNENPDLTVICDSLVWKNIATQEIEARQAIKENTIKLIGDRQLFSKLPRYFPSIRRPS